MEHHQTNAVVNRTMSDRAAHGVRQVLSRGETLYTEDDFSGDWFIVLSGVLRTCRYLPDGHRQVTGFFFPEDVFGLEAPTRRTSAEAVTEVVLMRYDRAFIDGDEGVTLPTIGHTRNLLLVALDAAEGRIELLGLRSACERVSGFLLRMDSLMDEDGYIFLPMGRADIADYLALTVETVSRTLSLLARRKLLSFRGPQRVLLVNRSQLEELAGGRPWSSPTTMMQNIAYSTKRDGPTHLRTNQYVSH